MAEFASADASTASPAELIQWVRDAAPVISAVRELREQVRAERVQQKAAYPGRRSGVDPVEFLKATYGAEIASGQLGPGQLCVIDKKLYDAVRNSLPGTDDAPSMQHLFEALRAPEKHGSTPYQRRAVACASVLGTEAEQAAQFFGSLRPGNIRDSVWVMRAKRKAEKPRDF